jgi:hypothetical protein
MTTRATADSYVVRIYRVDTEDQKNLTGLVEAMDGSGERLPFKNIDQLAEVLQCGVAKTRLKPSRRVLK